MLRALTSVLRLAVLFVGHVLLHVAFQHFQRQAQGCAADRRDLGEHRDAFGRAGKRLLQSGASWLDPLMGIAGAALVTVWAIGLLRSTGRVLLDAEMDAPVVAEVREAIAELPQPTAVSDLHVWRVGRGQYAAIVSLVTTQPLSPQQVREALSIHEELVHVTVEINAAPVA